MWRGGPETAVRPSSSPPRHTQFSVYALRRVCEGCVPSLTNGKALYGTISQWRWSDRDRQPISALHRRGTSRKLSGRLPRRQKERSSTEINGNRHAFCPVNKPSIMHGRTAGHIKYSLKAIEKNVEGMGNGFP